MSCRVVVVSCRRCPQPTSPALSLSSCLFGNQRPASPPTEPICHPVSCGASAIVSQHRFIIVKGHIHRLASYTRSSRRTFSNLRRKLVNRLSAPQVSSHQTHAHTHAHSHRQHATRSRRLNFTHWKQLRLTTHTLRLTRLASSDFTPLTGLSLAQSPAAPGQPSLSPRSLHQATATGPTNLSRRLAV